ncbi:hypothetical protein [Pseudomonas plecoglossicida]|uniref:hypothetical protein n=1 Tax=Pseudomonas plecoglossicida TaxID=70775 RepID=UPI0012E00A42|nr:hypothetical protein [Pseudomonas plecoglossicida]
MNDSQRVQIIEKQLEQALASAAALEARLGQEASQRAAADAVLSQRISSIESKVRG